jgi:hypothetical protein
LLDRFEPEDMTIQIGDKQIQVTEHSVKCVFGLTFEGRDLPMITDDAGNKILRDVATHIFLISHHQSISRSTLTELCGDD